MTNPDAGNPIQWVQDGEKYALIGMSTKIRQPIPFREVLPGFWAWTDQHLTMPAHWREWLGTIRADEIEESNLALVCKMASDRPEILDAESQHLQAKVGTFYSGLLLSALFSTAHEPMLLTGARRGAEIGVREQSIYDTPIAAGFRPYPELFPHHVEQAARLATSLEQMKATLPSGGGWRIIRILSLYIATRTLRSALDRLHQFCRCIDGLVASEPGAGKRHFKSRSELFIGPKHHDLMGALYDIRSDVEHLYEHRYLDSFDRAQRLDLVQKEAIAEHIARHALAHIIASPALWPHFGTAAAVQAFWQLPASDRQALWAAPPIDPQDALNGFDPDLISDAVLGA